MRSLPFLVFLIWPLVPLAGLNTACAESPSDATPLTEFYINQIKPLLKHRCYACHGALKQEGGLRLDTAQLLEQGGTSGPSIVRGNRSTGPLIERIASEDLDLRMPQEGEPLTTEQIELIGDWIAAGAPRPKDELPEPSPKDHWAYRHVAKPKVPSDNTDWAINEIDRFVARGHRRQQLVPQAMADELTLVRRLYMDLIGMPPTPSQREAISFSDPQWYRRLVEQLLSDPRYGERWGRHWMDIWRYSDWWGLGDQLRNSQPHIWHWRDWIVESLNDDLPYDEMLRQMLAADELYPGDLSRLRATGFLARNYFLFNRNQWMEETVEHVSKSLLGITMNCAKCHDHKFDPIDQTDFYRMRAFFEPYHVRLDMIPGEVDFNRDAIPRAFDGLLDEPTYLFRRGEESQAVKDAPIEPGLPAILTFQQLNIKSIELPPESWKPELQSWIKENYLAAARAELKKAEQAFSQLPEQSIATDGANQAADEESPENEARLQRQLAFAELELARAELCRIEAAGTLTEAISAQRRCQLWKSRKQAIALQIKLLKVEENMRTATEEELNKVRLQVMELEQNLDVEIQPDETVEPLVGAKWTATRFLNSTADDPTVAFPPRSTGRRRALAEWITSGNNPLTARVAVNHIWNRHFGTPLVSSVFDFGRSVAQPIHHELLDWLAAELIESNWSMKQIHRKIVMSATYRLSSSNLGCEQSVMKDPDNQYLWRRDPIRIESQAVRDSILNLAGELDFSMFGPPVAAAEQEKSSRRSIYFFHSNNDRNLFLTVFDEARVKECYQRDQSIVPQQALALVNSRLVLQSAARIAVQCGSESLEDDQFIRESYATVLAAQPSEDELDACRIALRRWASLQGGSKDQSRHLLIWSLLNHNDFVTLR